MEAEIEQIGKILLDAPVGYVEQTISDIIKKPVYLKVEQNSISGTKYLRKVVIGYDRFPILGAVVTFDHKNIPKPVMTALLQKKQSIGRILRNNGIVAKRRLKTINFDPTRSIVTREYDIVCNDSIWFEVSETIKLDFLCACKDS
jgi:chorismate-pyruvate lyase